MAAQQASCGEHNPPPRPEATDRLLRVARAAGEEAAGRREIRRDAVPIQPYCAEYDAAQYPSDRASLHGNKFPWLCLTARHRLRRRLAVIGAPSGYARCDRCLRLLSARCPTARARRELSSQRISGRFIAGADARAMTTRSTPSALSRRSPASPIGEITRSLRVVRILPSESRWLRNHSLTLRFTRFRTTALPTRRLTVIPILIGGSAVAVATAAAPRHAGATRTTKPLPAALPPLWPERLTRRKSLEEERRALRGRPAPQRARVTSWGSSPRDVCALSTASA